MKIYRVVPDSFVTGKRFNAHGHVSSEDIYYRMGYIPFLDELAHHDYNNLQCKNKQGKYFYLFAEDAIQEGNSLINVYHRLRADTFFVVEYDVPIDIIMKNIGYGDYTRGIMPLFLAETFIEKRDLGSSIITSDQVKENELLKKLILAFKDSLKRIQEYGSFAYADYQFYTDYFGIYDLSSINDEEIIKNALLNSNFYSAFLYQQCELVLSTYITGKALPVNIEFISHKLGGLEEYSKYCKNLGVRCDFSKEHREFKEEFLSNIKKENPDNEQIKKLLRGKNYL